MAVLVLCYEKDLGQFFGQLIGAAQLATGAITSGKLGALSVNSPDINWGAITSGKLASGFPLNNLLFETQSFINLLVNGDFEIGDPPVGWEVVSQTWARSGTKKIGTYSVVGTRAGSNAYLKQTVLDVTRYRGRKVTIGGWVYATTAGQSRLECANDVDSFQTTYHPGDGTWKWLTATGVVNAAAAYLEFWCCIYTTDGTAYFDGAMLVEGDTCPAFSPMPVDIQSITSGKVAPSSILSGNIAPLSIGDLHIISGLDAGKMTIGTLVDARLPTILGGKTFSGMVELLMGLAPGIGLTGSGIGQMYFALPGNIPTVEFDANLSGGRHIISGPAWRQVTTATGPGESIAFMRSIPQPPGSEAAFATIFRLTSGGITNVIRFDGVDVSEHIHLGTTGDAPKILSGGIGSGQVGATHIVGSDRSCRVKNSVNQSAINNDWTALVFDSEDWDTDNIHDTVTSSSILTCRTAGRHLVFANVLWSPVASPAGGRTVYLFLNGAITYYGQDSVTPIANWNWAMMANALFDLAINDRIEVRVYHNQGAAVDINGAQTRFGMIRII